MGTAIKPVAASRTRVESIDLLRGIVMILMVLDHTRDYVHKDGPFGDPTNLMTTTPILFMTRWVTHYCAPAFVFLAGVSAYLQRAGGTTAPDLSRFLWTRGLWLVFLECTVIRICNWFNVDYSFLATLQVIWTLGISMIVLAGLVRLPISVAAVFGAVMVLLHNAFDWVHVTGWQGPGTPAPGAWGTLWILLHQTGEILPVLGGPVVFVIYPLIPWVGVIALGYVTGQLYTLDADRRRTWLRRIGVALIVAFVVIRATNLYGDPSPWSVQQTALFSVLSFVNVTKYPASLLFLLMTIGPALVALSWFESRGRLPLTNTLVRVGRVPMFFYLLQWPFAHGIGIVASVLAGKAIGFYFVNPLNIASARPPDAGFDLPIVYVCWIVVLLVLIPLSVWYAGVKQRHRSSLLRYV